MREERGLNHSQHKYLFHPDAARPVVLIGAGGVGSMVAEKLAKYGVRSIAAYDPDVVESHNIPSSAYGLPDLGVRKVIALRDRLLRDCDLEIEAHARRWDGDAFPDGAAVVACVDAMDARIAIWKAVRKNPRVEVLIDTRVSEEYVRVYGIDPFDADDIAEYDYATRYGTAEANPTTCGQHGVPDVNGLAADLAVALLRGRWMRGSLAKRIVEFKLDEVREILP